MGENPCPYVRDVQVDPLCVREEVVCNYPYQRLGVQDPLEGEICHQNWDDIYDYEKGEEEVGDYEVQNEKNDQKNEKKEEEDEMNF